MSQTSRWTSLALTALVGLVLAPAVAEVSVEVDPGTGEYRDLHLLMNSSSPKPKIWHFNRTGKKGLHPLNPQGDLNGDGLPVVLENANGDGLPWAVWSRPTEGGASRMAWSRWSPGGWTGIATVAPQGSSDESSPALEFNSGGRPYLAFLRERPDGTQEVRFTLFLMTDWAVSIGVSAHAEDASRPSINIVSDQTVEVSYWLPDGTERTVTVAFADPHTITDDVYPFLTDTATITMGILG
jgi:hypothetical protein